MVFLEEMKETVKIPEGVTAILENNLLTIKGEKGEISRNFFHPKVNMKLNGNIIEISGKNVRRKEKALIRTFAAHVENMIKGVTKGFEYNMKTVYSHFPIKTSVQDNFFVIQNFLGEKSPRRARILEGVTVEIKGDTIKVRGIDKEKVGQTVANIERATRVRDRDVRVFQDGIYFVGEE